jgi:drug/metabolite transporter (DMT)-like permease
VSGDVPSSRKTDAAAGARLLVLLLAFAWGFNWIGAAIALREVSPWSLRIAGSGIGAFVLFTAALLGGYSLRVPRKEIVHVMIAGFFNVAAFQILSGFAQLNGATSRAVIITYSMPIWATLMSFFVLGERMNAMRWLALALCVAGVGVLVWPLFVNGVPTFFVLSLGCAFSWAFATVYMKWVKATVPPLANAAWQLLFGELFIAAGTFIFEGTPHLWPLTGMTIAAIFYVGVFGVGLAHFLWWAIVGKLPTVTASLGSLLVPVVGVIASTLILGERPTLTDIAGFALIFSAAACVLLQPDAKDTILKTEMPE